MTKADIINEVSIATGVPKKDVGVVIEAFMDQVKTSLVERKENVYLRGFGSFNIKHRAAKIQVFCDITKKLAIFLQK